MSFSLSEFILKGKRYYLPSEKSYEELSRRVARWLATAEALRAKNEREAQAWEERYFEIFRNKLFIANSPLLFNAGIGAFLKRKPELLYKKNPSLKDYEEIYRSRIVGESGSACFVIPIGDSLEEIYRALQAQGLIFKTGGGAGIDFSPLRPAGDSVKEVEGAASGPIEFMRLFDLNTEVIKSGYRRRGANMGLLNVNHPDIINFIRIKKETRSFRNFNLSVKVNSEFMKAALNQEGWKLINPRNGRIWSVVGADEILNEIARHAWETGDPGMIFIDRINLFNDLPGISRIEATNPCGEEPLHPWGSCNLGSIDIAKFCSQGEIEWHELRKTVKTAVRALNAVIDMSFYPLSEINLYAKSARPIGLGIMGFAHALLKLKISYDSEEAVSLIKKMISFIYYEARSYSNALAREMGVFNWFDRSIYAMKGMLPIAWREEKNKDVLDFWKEMKLNWEKLEEETARGTLNSRVLTIAPTGTISMIAETSSGIEPIFATTYSRRIEINGEHKTLKITDPILREIKKDERKYIKTALEIEPEVHILVQAAAQRYVDASVSKTINLKENTGVEKVKDIFILAWEKGCKGITVYRDKTKRDQVISCSCERWEER
ncbi:MAG: adenosylcobalamin-dependent ribonucleoside-diphosphate reductase [Synergistetes bacterium]|nr:adenosylcobalamin-dependent ribonucleoside-diphosphate reductase [Synergistota bacterium]